MTYAVWVFRSAADGASKSQRERVATTLIL